MAIDLSSADVRLIYSTVLPDLQQSGKEWRGRCPVHEGEGQNFAVNPDTGRAFCHSKCKKGWDLPGLIQELYGVDFPDALEEVSGILNRELKTNSSSNGKSPHRSEEPWRRVAEYRYVDENDELLYQIIRQERGKGTSWEKKFLSQRPAGTFGVRGVRRVLYNLPRVISARTVFLVEGEKAADALNELLAGSQFKDPAVATTAPFGAGNWVPEYAEPLRGKFVVAIPDNDDPGRRHILDVAQSVAPVADTFAVIELPDLPVKGDVVEFVEAGGNVKQIRDLVRIAQPLTAKSLPALAERWGISNGGEQPRSVGDDSSVSVEDEWPEPIPITGQLPRVEAFTPELLPVSLRPWACDVCERMQVPLDFAGAAIAVALAGAINRKVLVQPKARDGSWLVVPNLWGAIVARPGFKKSPLIDEVTKPFKKLQREYSQRHEAEMQTFDTANEEFEIELSAWKVACRKAIEKGNSKLPKPTPPSKPTERRLFYSDATFEALHQAMIQHAHGVFVLRDELSGWFAQLERTGREQERAFCLECWNGTSPFVIDRIGRGSVNVEHACLSLFGGIQPGRLTEYLAGAVSGGLGDDGLIQRLQVLVYPELPETYNRIDRPPDVKAQECSERVFRLLLELPAEEDPSVLRFTADAQELFDDWYDDLQRRVRHPEINPALASHLSKYASLMPSLAVLFHLADQVAAGPLHGADIAIEHAQRAAQWTVYLESHASRVYSAIIRPEMRSAVCLSEKIQKRAITESFNVRDIYRKCWTGLDTPERVKAAVDILESHDWVRALPSDPAGKAGRPPLIQYVVNPKIWGRNGD